MAKILLQFHYLSQYAYLIQTLQLPCYNLQCSMYNTLKHLYNLHVYLPAIRYSTLLSTSINNFGPTEYCTEVSYLYYL